MQSYNQATSKIIGGKIMEFTQLVEDRRSIRSYKAGMIIAKNDLEEMI